MNNNTAVRSIFRSIAESLMCRGFGAMVENRGLFSSKRGPEAPRPDLGRGPALVKLFGCRQKAKEQEDQGDPMAKYTSVLHQLLRHVPRDEFRAIVGR